MIKKLYYKLFPAKYENTDEYRQKAAKNWDSKLLKYVTERTEKGDKVIAKDAYICVKGGYVFVNSETESVFKCPDTKTTSGELMSRDGVILSGFDEIKGEERSIICYFKYYR